MLKLRSVLLNSKAAIDLASIMVGIIVIGLIGGVIAATVFAVIPWAQDNAAKQQLESIHTAQNAAFGLSADPSRTLRSEQERNSFTNSESLEQQGLLARGSTYCTINQGKDDYLAYSVSGSGKTFIASNKNRQATPLTGAIAEECATIINGDGVTTPPAVEEPKTTAPIVYGTRTSFTYRCDARTVNVKPPLYGTEGTLTWINKDTGQVLSETSTVGRITLEANVNYQAVFDGTFTTLRSTNNLGDTTTLPGSNCLRSLDEWNENTGTVTAMYAFRNSLNLVSIPEQIPSSVTNASAFFQGASKFNDDITGWDMKNVKNVNSMFDNASAFNQDISKWDADGFTDLSSMFNGATVFNQNISSWNTENITDMRFLFNNAKAFNQDISGWNVSKVQNMNQMFAGTTFFNQDISGWDVSKVTAMNRTFNNAKAFNQNISGWKVSQVKDKAEFRTGSALTTENAPKF